MPKLITYAVLAVSLYSLACQTKHSSPKKDESSIKPKTFAQIDDFDNEIFPLANGNAYLINQTSEQLFLLSKAQACRVEGVQMRGLVTTIFPLPDGSAYLAGSNGQNLRIYHLIDAKAIEVNEVPVLISSTRPISTSPESYLWCQLQSANMRARKANAKSNESNSIE